MAQDCFPWFPFFIFPSCFLWFLSLSLFPSLPVPPFPQCDHRFYPLCAFTLNIPHVHIFPHPPPFSLSLSTFPTFPSPVPFSMFTLGPARFPFIFECFTCFVFFMFSPCIQCFFGSQVCFLVCVGFCPFPCGRRLSSTLRMTTGAETTFFTQATLFKLARQHLPAHAYGAEVDRDGRPEASLTVLLVAGGSGKRRTDEKEVGRGGGGIADSGVSLTSLRWILQFAAVFLFLFQVLLLWMRIFWFLGGLETNAGGKRSNPKSCTHLGFGQFPRAGWGSWIVRACKRLGLSLNVGRREH